jgi:hypothetical protein
MRRVRIILGFATLLCAFGALSAPAFAHKKPKEKKFFGEFTASALGKTFSETEPGTVKGTGELENFQVAQLADIRCARLLRTTGKVTSARFPIYTTTISFRKSKCRAVKVEGHTVEEPKLKFGQPLVVKYHPAGFAEVEGEAEIEKSVGVSFKVVGGTCTVTIPPQTFPLKAVPKPEKHYSASEYATEHEPVEGTKKKKEMFPANPMTGLLAGEQEYVEIEDEFTKLKSEERVTPYCHEPGNKKTQKEIEAEEVTLGHPLFIHYTTGTFSAYFEERLVNGDFGFTTEV